MSKQPIKVNLGRKRRERPSAVGYLRVPKNGEVVDHDGLPRQRAAVRRYADRCGLELVEEFCDDGATDPAERPGLSQLLERVLTNGVRVVLVERADSLAKNRIESELLLRELRDAGVRVVAAADGIDLTDAEINDPTTKLIRKVLGCVAKFEKSYLVAKLRAARSRTGHRSGRTSFYGANAQEERILGEMRALRQQGHSYAEVAAQLNKNQLPTRTGAEWTRASVFSVLASRGLTGTDTIGS